MADSASDPDRGQASSAAPPTAAAANNNNNSSSSAGAAEWPTDPSRYQFAGKIGQGAFATVWKAELLLPPPPPPSAAEQQEHEERRGGAGSGRRECAVKVLNLDDVDTNLTEIRLEVQAMRLLRHGNVLACHAAFVSDRALWLVTPLMGKGSSLHSLQTARRVRRLQRRQQRQQGAGGGTMEPHILYILHETVKGLQYIHDNGQIHRDVKAGNILLDGTGRVVVADFGVSGFLVHAGQHVDKARTFVGTPCWMAPEVMEQVHGYDTRADLWSLGITALELARGYAPYAKYPPMKVLILTIQEDPPSLETYVNQDEDDDWMDEVAVDEEYSRQFSQLVGACLQKNPARRPSCADLLAGKHFAPFRDAAYLSERQRALCDEVLSQVPDVGSSSRTDGGNGTSSQQRRQMPGNAPVSILVQQQTEDRPAGTTWVFADGSSSSQVLSSTGDGRGGGGGAGDDDVFAALDEFGKETGGEHYDRTVSRSNNKMQQDRTVGHSNKKDEEGDEDDLEDFMNEFEQNTAGEDFRRAGGNR